MKSAAGETCTFSSVSAAAGKALPAAKGLPEPRSCGEGCGSMREEEEEEEVVHGKGRAHGFCYR